MQRRVRIIFILWLKEGEEKWAGESATGNDEKKETFYESIGYNNIRESFFWNENEKKYFTL